MDAKVAEMGVARSASSGGTVLPILTAISVCHLLNDLIQSLVPAIYPVLKESYALDFGQIGLITMAFQVTASLLQPVVGIYTDRHPKPFSLPIGMACTLVGLVLMSVAGSYPVILLAAVLIGIGSAVFHPESSRVARMASGGRHGFAQAFFQVGGNFGSAAGPLLAAFIVVPKGQGSVAWFSVVALAAIAILVHVGRWYGARLAAMAAKSKGPPRQAELSRRRIAGAMSVLVVLLFSKHFYMASFSSYFTFYLIQHFGLDVQSAQLCLFVFLAAVAAGVLIGGPLGDRFGRKLVIWASILGVLPFTLALPYVDLFWTIVLTVPIGLILASATPQIVVYAQELMPGRVGMASGLMMGFAFGMGGLGAALLGELADLTSIEFVYKVCAFLPAIGLAAAFLPNTHRPSAARL
jgi:FSR family fosmidomycin resistance protein-like MFS transporter